MFLIPLCTLPPTLCRCPGRKPVHLAAVFPHSVALCLPPCAGALAESPRILLLDELTTFLDMEDQFGVLQAVKRVTRR